MRGWEAENAVDLLPEARAHRERMWRWVGPHRERRRRGESHPVLDFLFEYYRFRPSQLLRWEPPRPGPLPAGRERAARWILGLLEVTCHRAPQFGCLGLHEWAMLYRREQRRHTGWPLRLGPAEIDGVVERLGLACTHFDAYRFFAAGAVGRNRWRLTREQQEDFEQPGCVHVTMDLYKWAYAFWPWTGSGLVADSFELAVMAREVDMRASPYDLRALGYEPIPIETEAGRLEYVRWQRELWERAQPLRQRLIARYRELLATSASRPDGVGAPGRVPSVLV